jgi:signal transduction histidine kinase
MTNPKTEIKPDEIETLRRLVSLAGIGMEQANLLNQMKQELALRNELEMQLDALNQASIEILNAATEKEAVEKIFAGLQSIGYTKAMLSLVNDSSNTIEGRYAIGENWKMIVHQTRCDLKGKDILAQALRTKSPILVKDCQEDSRCDPELIRKAGIKSQYAIPLMAKDKAIGTLQIGLTDKPELVHGDETVLHKRMKVVEAFAQQVAIAIRNIRDLIKIDRLESNIAETAHEFRAPLHNIMTQVGGLKFHLEQSQQDQKIDQYVGAIQEEIMRAKRHMDNTLLLSDRTREKLEYVFKAGYLQDLIDTCISMYNFRALERGLRFIVKDGVKRLPRIEFDRDRMEQALNNLIDNAIKYSHYDRLIIINGFDDGTNINIEITDWGLGIPSHEFETIFKGFLRGDARDKRRYIPGTGLGLKICQEIILKHGGQVKVRSEPATKNPKKIKEYQEYSTTFRVMLPKHRREN